MLSVEIRGLDKLQRLAGNMANLENEMRGILSQTAQEYGMRTLRTIREQYLSGPGPSRLKVGKSGFLRAKTIVTFEHSAKGVILRFGNNLAYGRIHEFGGVTKPTVSRKMRSWAWYKFSETGDPLYKYLALTKKTRLNIVIPARPYLRPAIMDNMPWLIEAIGIRTRGHLEARLGQ